MLRPHHVLRLARALKILAPAFALLLSACSTTPVTGTNLAWVRQFGAPRAAVHFGNGVAVDVVGNAYVVGSVVAKFAPNGIQQWLDVLPLDTRGEAVAVDVSGNAYFVGWRSSDQKSWIEKRDVFGNEVWRVELINPINVVRAYGVAVTPGGEVVVTGTWLEGALVGDGNSAVAFLAKYSALGEQSYLIQPSFPFPGEWYSEGFDVAGDALGNVYMTGFAGRSTATDGEPLRYAYVAKFDASGTEVWTKRFSGGIGESTAKGIAANASADRVCVTGWVDNALEGASSAGFSDAYVVCYDTSGTRLWMRQFGTTAVDYGHGIAMDEVGNIFVAGRTEGNFGGTLDGLTGGGTDAFLARYDRNGNQTHLWEFGTAQADGAYDVAADTAGNVYVTGYSQGLMDMLGAEKGVFLVKVTGF
jgi:hypothetical protein